MKWLKKLDNPFLLAAKGFLVGALFFAATHPDMFETHETQIPPALAAR